MAAVALFEQGFGEKAVARRLGVSEWSAKKLRKRWQIRGRGALVAKPDKTKYTFEQKIALVRRVEAGETFAALALEADLSSPELLKRWVREFRRGGEDALRPKPKGRPRLSPPETLTELEQLRKENEYLRAKTAYLEKLKALRDQGHR